LVTTGEILEGHNARVRAAFRRVFAAKNIRLHERRCVHALTSRAIEFDDGSAIAADAVLLTTDAAPPGWFAAPRPARDAAGFIAVGPTVKALNEPDVFAAGDCAALVETPRDKAGVFAVRAGPPLAENLRRRARGRPLKRWRPQRRHLALISTGERYAVASRGAFKAEGAWLWKLKDRIDRRWMRMYQDVDRMLAGMADRPARHNGHGGAVEEMRCGGCAAKIGPGPLSRVLSRLPPARVNGVVVGLEARDDAAIVIPP